MQAVILAAGMGKRLGEKTRDNTKCMLEVSGIRLIDRTLEHLHAVGVDRIVLVVGYKGDKVRSHVGSLYKGIPVEYVENGIYDRTNNIYSLFLARDYLLEEDTLLLESDIIFNLDVLQAIVNDPYPNLALVDKYESWMDGTVVTLDAGCRIKSFLDKEEFRYEDIKNYYKTVNIYKFSKEFSERYYVPFLEAYSKALGNNAYYEQVLKVILLLRDAPIRALPLSGQTWYEIDDVQDLDIAQSMFAPDGESHYDSISARYGGYWRYPQMLDYCYLVNPYFPPQRMMDEIKASFEALTRAYPSGMKVNSLLAAKNFGIKPEHIMVGNGAAELIKALMESTKGAVGCVFPTFEEYPNRLPASRVVAYTPQSSGFRYTAPDLIQFFSGRDISALVLVNPDNPSGNCLSRNSLKAMLDWSSFSNIRLVVDESFLDFSERVDEISLLSDSVLEKYSNLVVIKSISKSYGVPGLRLGALASADEALVAKLKKDVAIWNINSFGEYFLQIFEKYKDDYDLGCRQLRAERERFAKLLAQIPWLEVYPSEANYLLCRLKGRFTSHELAVKLLADNLWIKDCSGKKGMEAGDYIRLSVRCEEDNDRLVEKLKSL